MKPRQYWREAHSAGMQSYRIEDGKLVETWLSVLPLGSAWPDVGRQERWTGKNSS
jgi:hypothetical protein